MKRKNSKPRVAVIGAGNLGSSIVEAIHDKADVIATRRDRRKLEDLKERFPGIRITTDNSEAAGQSDVVILSVKPKAVPEVLEEVDLEDKLLISAAAGISIEELKSETSGRVARIMAGLFVKEEVVFYTAEDPDVEVIDELFGPETVRVDEEVLAGRTFIACDTGLIPKLIQSKVDELEEHGVPKPEALKAYGATLSAIGKRLSQGVSGDEIFEQVTGGSEESFTYGLYEQLKEGGCEEEILKALRRTIDSC